MSKLPPRLGACLRTVSTRRLCAVASTALLVIAVFFRQSMTATMVLHMLVHIPVILVAGVLAGQAGLLDVKPGAPGCKVHWLAKYNGHGIPGLLAVAFMMAYWMIPRSLDNVLVSDIASIAKFAGLFIAGLLLLDSLRRADSVIKLFFLGNFVWMTAIVGLVYQENPARLCNSYLMGDQEATGFGLVIVAAVLPMLWLWAEYRQSRQRTVRQASGFVQ